MVGRTLARSLRCCGGRRAPHGGVDGYVGVWLKLLYTVGHVAEHALLPLQLAKSLPLQLLVLLGHNLHLELVLLL